jgi:hypothetical protein
VFAAAGYSGAHLDVVAGNTVYHTERDSLANLDPGALQRQGAAMLALARHFGAIPLGATRADDAALVTAFGVPICSYPLGWTLPLALAAGVGLLLIVGFGLWRRRLTPRGLAGAVLVLVLGAGALALVTQLAWQAVVAAHPESSLFAERGFYGQGWYLGGTYSLALALALAAGSRLVRRVGARHLAAAGVAAGAVLALLFAVARPGTAYLALWPALAGVLMLACLVGTAESPGRRRSWIRFAVLLVTSVPAIGLLVGALYEPVIDGLAEGPALLVAVLMVLRRSCSAAGRSRPSCRASRASSATGWRSTAATWPRSRPSRRSRSWPSA